ncbi:MAG: hypothetical protein OXF11_15120 [Deltaproteobacteria bacterium]|nr:hypothetical protein [Deltaproteobacteria bacterium]
MNRPTLLPGPVLSNHAAFENDCGQCHASVEEPSLAWAKDIAGAALFGVKRDLANTARCMACHDFGPDALAAHGTVPPAAHPAATDQDESRRAWSETRRASLTTRLAAAVLPADYAMSDTPGARGSIACAVCHREHEGRDFVATAMTDARCQVCHTGAFTGFAGHPPFTDYPHHPVSRVAFDHGNHFSRHFAAAAKDGATPPATCGTCHTGEMAIDGFSACASCHEAELTRPVAGSPDLEFLAPPGLDLEVLADAGIGDWPVDAEAEPNAFLRLMLEAGGYLDAADMKTVNEADLLDLADAGEEERRAAAQLAWAFKKLTRDLVREGPSVFVEAAQPSSTVKADLAGSLPFEVVRHAADQWFPELADELERHQQGETMETRAIELDLDDPEGVEDMEEWLRYGGWRYHELALRYRPTGHADRFLRGWLTLSTTPTDTGAALFAVLTDEEAPSAGCAKCHVSRVEGTPASGGGTQPVPRLNWFARATRHVPPARVGEPPGSGSGTARATDPSIEPDTLRHLRTFSHRSHRQAVLQNGCVSCHRVAESKESRRSAAGFAPVSPADCATCHREKTGLARCLTCHRYHFEKDGDRRLLTGDRAAAREPSGK